MTTETASYGEWPSPITGADVARNRVGLAFPVIAGEHVWWQESRPAEGGRIAVVSRGPDGVVRNRLGMPWNARTRVHEYGGRSYLPLADGFLFANFADQRVYRCGAAGGDPQPLTPDAGDRFADFVLSPAGTEVWCVRERHADGRITRAIVSVPLDGSAADDDGAVRVLVSGSDFYAYPAPSPDGNQLAWICWDHPRMPWDGTELRVAEIGDPRHQVIMGGDRESVLAPAWRDDRSLYVVSDRLGWWNLYLVSADEPPWALCPREEEFAAPLWQLGAYPYAVLGDGRLAVSHGIGASRLGVLDPGSGQLTEVDLPYQVVSPWLSGSGRTVATIAGGPAVPLSVVKVDIPAPDENAPTAEMRVLRREAESLPGAAYLPVPRAVRLAGPSGSVIHALVYPPANPAVTAPDGELPPYIVWVHGGPTGHVVPALDLEKAFFTSRGIGIIDLNYGGSSGYGRAYRERLRGQWGVVDVADAMTAALALAKAGQADGKRLGIRGGSAGGWTALAAVTSGARRRDHRERGVRRGGGVLRRERPEEIRRANARLRVAVPGRPGRAAPGMRGGVRGAGARRPREPPHLPGAAAPGARRPDRAARPGRVHRRRTGRASDPVRLPDLRRGIARIQEGGDHRGQPGGRALLLRADHGVRAAGCRAGAARRRLSTHSGPFGLIGG